MLYVLRKLMAAHQAVYDVARFGGESKAAREWAADNHKTIDNLAWAVVEIIKDETGKTTEEIIQDSKEAG